MSEPDTEMKAAKPSMWQAAKYRLAIAGAAGMSLVGYASAAIDFSNISALLQAVINLIPDFLALVVAIAPLNGLRLENAMQIVL
jgi:hypothetical protein